MHRLRLLVAATLFCAAAIAVPANADLCNLLGTCADPAAQAVDADGALHVDTTMTPLAPPVPGQPLFDRVGGHLPLGLTERGYDNSPSGAGTAATGAQEAAFVTGIGGTLMRVPVEWARVEPE